MSLPRICAGTCMMARRLALAPWYRRAAISATAQLRIQPMSLVVADVATQDDRPA